MSLALPGFCTTNTFVWYDERVGGEATIVTLRLVVTLVREGLDSGVVLDAERLCPLPLCLAPACYNRGLFNPRAAAVG